MKREARNAVLGKGLLLTAAVLGCGPAVGLPGVHEPIDSPAWKKCAGDLAERESLGMIDDLTLDSKTLLCQGVARAAEGKIDEAVDLLTEAGVRDKADHRPHYLAGRILAEAGRYEEALAAFDRSAKRFPSLEVPAERLGRSILEKKDAEEARRFLALAEERAVCNLGCEGLLARLHHEAGKDDLALALYKKMTEADPSEPTAYVGLAAIHNGKADHAAEAASLEQARAAAHFKDLAEGDRAGILYSLAFARYNAKELDAAAAAVEEALDLDPARAEWHVLAGWIALKRSRPEEALTHFDKAAGIARKLVPAHVGRGDAHLAMGRLAEAEAAFDQARELDPTNAVVLLKLALTAARKGDRAAAERLLAEASRMDPDRLPADLLKEISDLIGAAAVESQPTPTPSGT